MYLEIDTKIDRNMMFLAFKKIFLRKKDWEHFPNLLFEKPFLLLSCLQTKQDYISTSDLFSVRLPKLSML